MADILSLLQMQADEAAGRRAALAQSIGNAMQALQNASYQKNRLAQMSQENLYRDKAYKDAMAQQAFQNAMTMRNAETNQAYNDRLLGLQERQLDLYGKEAAKEVTDEKDARIKFGQSLAAQARKAIEDASAKKKTFNELLAENQRLTETATRLSGKGVISLDKASKLFKLEGDKTYEPVVSKLNSAILDNTAKLSQAESDLKPALKGLADIQKNAARYQMGLDTDTGDLVDLLSNTPITPDIPKSQLLDSLGNLIKRIGTQNTTQPALPTPGARPGLGAAVTPSAVPNQPSRAAAMAAMPELVPLPPTINVPYRGYKVPKPLEQQILQEANSKAKNNNEWSAIVIQRLNEAYANKQLVPPTPRTLSQEEANEFWSPSRVF